MNNEVSVNQENHQNNSSSDYRIEIHTVNSNQTENMQENISSFINNARNQLGRQNDSGSRRSIQWRLNFSNVMQGVRPLVRQAQSINSFRTWTTQNRYIPVNRESNNDVHVNIDSNTNDENVNNVNREINNMPGLLNNATFATSVSPLFERVALLTRNDPPDIIGSSSLQRTNNHNQENNNDSTSNNNNNNDVNEEDSAVVEIFAQIPELHQMCQVLFRYIPLICILLIKSAYDHFGALTDFIFLLILFMHANGVIKNEVANSAQKRFFVLIREIALCAIVIYIKFFIISQNNPFICLTLIVSLNQNLTLSDVLYFVITTDYLIKIITIIIKIFVILLSPSWIKFKKRGKMFLLIEAISQLYRALAPIHLWCIFLLDSYEGFEKIFGVIICCAYMIIKGFVLIDRLKLLRKAISGAISQTSYGKVPTKDEIQAVGNLCSICHDNLDAPIKLDCSHIFCEQCVGTWFTRERTCPLCRAQVADDPSWQDGSTSHLIQLY